MPRTVVVPEQTPARPRYDLVWLATPGPGGGGGGGGNQTRVLVDGTIGDIRILRSLDKQFGLDEEAIKAAKQWRFLPGRRFGEPVPVIVTIELAFTLR